MRVRINPDIKEVATTREGIIEFHSAEDITAPIVYHELFHRHLARMPEAQVKQLMTELNDAMEKALPVTKERFENDEDLTMVFEEYALGKLKLDNPIQKIYEKWFPKVAIPKADEVTTYYHGTLTRRGKNILKEGLIASETKPVFLTTDIELAKDWGNFIVRIDLPKEFPVYLKGKERGFSEFFTRETIPPKYIKQIIPKSEFVIPATKVPEWLKVRKW